MSKIMRQMYAEARAAREGQAYPSDAHARVAQAAASSTLEGWSLRVADPVASARTTIAWWIEQVAQAGAQLRRSHAVVESLPSAWTSSATNVAIDPRFPLGTPLNRVAAKSPLRPITGRPNWFVDPRGVERYVEPKRATPFRESTSPQAS
jgi:hypothetical protein